LASQEQVASFVVAVVAVVGLHRIIDFLVSSSARLYLKNQKMASYSSMMIEALGLLIDKRPCYLALV
jgi:hypothetical protein